MPTLAWAQDIQPVRSAGTHHRSALSAGRPFRPSARQFASGSANWCAPGCFISPPGRHRAGARKQHRHRSQPLQSVYLGQWNLERAQAGGALPGVPSGASQAGSVASGQGVAGSQAAAGVSVPGARSSGSGSNATVSQIGPVTQNLDPTLQENTTFSHISSPQPDRSAKRRVQPGGNYARLQRKLPARFAGRRHCLSQLQRSLSERERAQRFAESYGCSQSERVGAAKSAARIRQWPPTPAPSRCRV